MKDRQRSFLVALLLITLALFLYLIKDYILALLMAGVACQIAMPLYRKLLNKTKNKPTLSATLTVLSFLVLIIVPLLFFAILLTEEAVNTANRLSPFINNQIDKISHNEFEFPSWLSFGIDLSPYKSEILSRLGSLASQLGDLLINFISSFTGSTFTFFINLTIFLYALFFYLRYGKKLLEYIQQIVPLKKENFYLLINRANSITLATLKGAILIGGIQGALIGVGFWFTRIPNPIFWGTVAAVASLIPSIGIGLVWLPGAIYLYFTGHPYMALLLSLWSIFIAGSVDNFLRPYLVGKDTKMPDLMVFVTTLGGISLFGLTGVIIGPVIGGLLMSIFDIYKKEYSRN